MIDKPSCKWDSGHWQLIDRGEAVQRGALEKELKKPRRVFLKDMREVLRSEIWTCIPLGEWTAACRLLPQNGVPVIAELRIFPTPPKPGPDAASWTDLADNRAKIPNGGISSRMLRELRLRISGEAFKEFRKYVEKDKESWPYPKGWLAPYLSKARRKRRGGRPDVFYARVAQLYCAALESGSRNPIRQIAKTLKETPVKVRDMVLQARRRGLLTPAPKQGRMGGILTPEAIKRLNEKPVKRRK